MCRLSDERFTSELNEFTIECEILCQRMITFTKHSPSHLTALFHLFYFIMSPWSQGILRIVVPSVQDKDSCISKSITELQR